MAFCSNCGAQLEEGTRFCSSCGSAVDAGTPVAAPVAPSPVAAAPMMGAAPVMDYQMQQNLYAQQQKARQDSINELAKMISYFSEKTDLYQEYDVDQNKLAYLMKGTGKAPLVWGIIITAIFGFSAVVSFLSVFSDGLSLGWMIGLGIQSFFVLLGILLIVVYIVKSSKNKSETASYRTRLADIAYELTNHYVNYGFCALGAEYTNPAILVKVADVIRSGCADNPKEAINTLLNDNRKSMMHLQKQLGIQASRQEVRNDQPAAVFAPGNYFR